MFFFFAYYRDVTGSTAYSADAVSGTISLVVELRILFLQELDKGRPNDERF